MLFDDNPGLQKMTGQICIENLLSARYYIRFLQGPTGSATPLPTLYIRPHLLLPSTLPQLNRPLSVSQACQACSQLWVSA